MRTGCRCDLLLAFLVVWSMVSGFSLPAFHAKAEDTTSQPANLVVLVKGQVSVKRRGWTSYAPVVFGTTLRLGDLVRAEDAANAQIVCSDLTIHHIQTGQVAVPCMEAQPLLKTSNGSLLNPTRSWPTEGTFPLVLSPRKTKLLSPNPVLRWATVAGATHYQIQVRGPNLQWSAIVGAVTEYTYPASAPALEPGVDYKLIVATQTSSSSAEPGNGLGFSLLDKKQKQAVEGEEGRIRQLGLSEPATQFVIANLYASHGLNAEAIELLDAASTSFKVAAVKRLQADLYMRVGLLRRAELCYLESLRLSADEGDELGAMQAQLALARIYLEFLGNDKAAAEQLNSLAALANKLGDEQTAQLAGLLLAETNKRRLSQER